MYRVDMCVVYAGRGRMRSKNIVSDAQVSPAGRTNVREIVIEIVQIKQYMSAYCLAPLQVDCNPTWVPADVCGVPLSNNLL